MADSLSDILNGTGNGPDLSKDTAPAEPGKVTDSLSQILHGNTAAPVSPQLRDVLQTGSEKGFAETVGRGFMRGGAQALAIAPSIKAMYKEYTGDMPGAIEDAKAAKEIGDTYGDSDWNLQNIKSPGDFGYWVGEKLGEQGVNMLSMMMTGGAGGMGAKMLAQNLLEKGLITQATARNLMISGSTLPIYGLTSAMEAANTSQEQFEVSGGTTTKPELSTVAGLGKGVLESFVPFTVARALRTPGLQLGATVPRAIGKIALEEGATEMAQEAVDIYARQLSDPNYSYFKDGFTLNPSGFGPGMWRILESGAAGAVVGGIYGAPFARMEHNQEARRSIGEEPPGTRNVLPPLAPSNLPGLALDIPSAEPLKDLKAQAKDLFDPNSSRQAVWIPSSNREVHSPEEISVLAKAGVPIENFDHQGGLLIAKNQEVANQAIAARDRLNQTGEYPVAAAARVNDKIFQAPVHAMAVEEAKKEFGQKAINDAVETSLRSKEAGINGNDLSGFVTNLGRYVSREEAARMVPEAGRSSIHASDLPINNPSRPRTLQELIGKLVGAGEGKPSNGTHVVQQLDKNGAVTRESLVTQDQVQDTVNSFKQLGKTVRVVSPQEAIQRRDDENLLGIVAPDKVAIRPTYSNSKSETWEVKSRYGSMHVRVNKVDKVAQISNSSLNEESQKGKGHGLALYKAVFDKALNEGYTVKSDSIVSEEASRMYEAFKRRGYEVEGPKGRKVSDQMGNYYSGMSPTQGDEAVFTVTSGPVTKLMQMVRRIQKTEDKNLSDSLQRDPLSDALSVNSLVTEIKNEEQAREAMLDMLEANTPRYISLWTGDRQRLLTDTDIELEQAINIPQSANPRLYVRVDQDKLQPAGITAHLSDLPHPNSNRIWFIENTPAVSRQLAMEAYQAMWDTFEKAQMASLKNAVNYRDREALLKPYYDKITTMGLRVIPSRGKGFYYNAVVTTQGEPIGIIGTKRSPYVAVYDPMTRQVVNGFSENAMGMGEGAIPRDSDFLKRAIPVSVDLNVLKEGVDYEISFENRNLLTPGGSVKLLKPLNPAALIPGIKPTIGQISDLNLRRTPLFRQPFHGPPRVVIADDPQYAPGNIPLSMEMKRIFEKLSPAIGEILEKIGIKGRMDIAISEKYSHLGPVAHLDEGLIYFSPQAFTELKVYSGEVSNEVVLTEMMMHEVGHFVTVHYWSKLPVEIQGALRASWEKAVLQLRMGEYGKTGLVPSTPLTTANLPHWATFSEWLAEQFRRWSTSNSTATTELDSALKGISKQLENFYKEWEKKIGTQKILDLTKPDYYFSALMEYLKGYKEVRTGIEQKLRQHLLLTAHNDVLESPVLTSIANTVISAAESMGDMFPPGLKANLRKTLSPELTGNALIPSTGMASGYHQSGMNLDFIEMSMLALMELPGQHIGNGAKMYLAHELWHSYERRELVTKEEIALLDREIKGNEKRLLPVEFSDQATAIRNAVLKAYAEANRTSPEDIKRAHEIAQSLIDQEARAYYIMRFANTGIAQSEQSKTIMARILAFIERLKNYLNNLGYQTHEDLLRAIFKGEIAHRNDRAQEDAQVTEFFAGEDQKNSSIEPMLRLHPSVRQQPFQSFPNEVQVQESANKIGIPQNEMQIPKIRSIAEHHATSGLRISPAHENMSPQREAEIEQSRRDTRNEMAKTTRSTFEVIPGGKQDNNILGLIEPSIKEIEVEPGIKMRVSYFGGEQRNSMGRLYSKAVSYMFTSKVNVDGQQRDILVGAAKLVHHGPKGYEIQGIQAQVAGRLAWARVMMAHIARDTGIPLIDKNDPFSQLLRPAGEISKTAMATYKWWARGQFQSKEAKQILNAYVSEDGLANVYSPNFVKKMLAFYQIEQIRQKDPQYVSQYSPETVKEKVALYKRLLAKVDPSYFEDPRTKALFSLKRNFNRDELQGTLLLHGKNTDEEQLKNTLGDTDASQKIDNFSEIFNQYQKFSQAENARRDNLEFDLSAPSTQYSMSIRKIWEWSTGYGNAPSVEKELVNTTRHEADRIGKFTKFLLSIQQLAWMNEHIVPLQKLISLKDLSQQLSARWAKQASETAHEWDSGRSPERKESIAKVLFDLTEQRYRAPTETIDRVPDNPALWQAFLAGGPAGPELANLFRAAKLKREDVALIRRIQNDFLGFLAESEQHLAANFAKTFASNPAQLALAITKLTADMNKMRQKPYFPMVRFGEFIATARENGKVVATYAFATQSQRDSAVEDIRRKYPTSDITVGRIPLHVVEFAGLPGPLLNQIKEGILTEDPLVHTADQIALIRDQKRWIEEFEALNDPDKTFRKRWMPAKGLPGYSMDALRAYSHYFQSGSRYLARLAYMKDMRAQVLALQNRAMDGRMGNFAKSKAIADYSASWLKYYLEGGRDAGKFRALASLWYLGFSPAAATMNLTQPWITTIPFIGRHFGVAQAYASWLKANGDLAKNMGYGTGDASFKKGRDEMIRQGYIDVGQAAELSAFAEGNNLSKLKVGTKVQQFWRKLNYAGMYMFQGAEHYNRELTFKMAWDLAIANPKNPRLLRLDAIRFEESTELQARLGMTGEEALAFLFAKEAIERTQFAYDKASDPPFMRNKAKDILIFFKYTQSMLYAFAKNGASIHMLLLFAFLYGLNGLPGADDLNEILRLVARKLWGNDFDFLGWARKFTRDMTKGGIFDETGPDLVLHGISRYGFGLPMLPWIGYAAPSFDASANGSMGKVIPGFAEIMHGINNGKSTNDLISDGVSRASGAGYGIIFGLLHALNDPGSADSKKWLNIMQRQVKAFANAYRLLPPDSGLPSILGVKPEGAPTNSHGARIPTAKFDASDPADIASIITQAAGFQPTKVARAWEALRQTQDEMATYKARRSVLYVQMDKALLENNAAAIEDARKAIVRYNDEVSQIDPQMVIKANQLVGSLKERQRQKAMMESAGFANKGAAGVTQRILDLYPGMKVEKVR